MLMDSNKKILLVDDHDLVRFGTSMLLQSLEAVQCTITPCRSLEEARTACREQGPFDLVLLDLNLPDAKGLQGLRTLLNESPDVPFAMLTGTQDEFVIRQAQAMGAVGYLLKSWTPERLKAALRQRRANRTAAVSASHPSPPPPPFAQPDVEVGVHLLRLGQHPDEQTDLARRCREADKHVTDMDERLRRKRGAHNHLPSGPIRGALFECHLEFVAEREHVGAWLPCYPRTGV